MPDCSSRCSQHLLDALLRLVADIGAGLDDDA